MSEARRRRGFERAGCCGPSALPLPRRRTRELELELAWRAAAGAALARRTRARGVRRGVLEVEVTDTTWLAAVRDLLPELAARVAARHPELAIRRCLLVSVAPGPAGEEVVTTVARIDVAPQNP